MYKMSLQLVSWKKNYADTKFKKNNFSFGSETKGLPKYILKN